VGMANEVAVDGNLSVVYLHGLGFKPSVNVSHGIAGGTLAQKQDVGDDRGAFSLEGIRRQADRSEKIGPIGEVLANGPILFVQREVAGDNSQHSARSQGVERLGHEKIVE